MTWIFDGRKSYENDPKKKVGRAEKKGLYSLRPGLFSTQIGFLTGLKIWPDLYLTEYLSNFPPYMQLSMHSWVKWKNKTSTRKCSKFFFSRRKLGELVKTKRTDKSIIHQIYLDVFHILVLFP